VVFLFLVSEAAVSEPLAEALDKILSDPLYKRAKYGAVVRRLADGAVLYERNPDGLLSVASNAKLFTTAAALDTLGPDFQFRTPLYITGQLADGVLEGDLAVRGSGDPNISGRFFDGDRTAIFRSWAEKLKAYGVKKVTGGILLDDSLFDREYTHPDWARYNLASWYCAPVSALSFNDNCLDLKIEGVKDSATALVTCFPETGFATIVNRVRVFRRGTLSIRIDRKPVNVITLRGRIACGQSYEDWVATDEPSLYFGSVLKGVLAESGVEVVGGPKLVERLPQGLRQVAEFVSSLRPTIAVANKRSQNFYSEQLFKLLGARMSGQGSFRSGAGAVVAFLKKCGIDPARCQVSDGSGLSRRNRYTPAQVVQLLVYMRGHKDWRDYVGSLSIGGVDGQLAKRFTDPRYRGRVYAKTGTLAGVAALSGYVCPDSPGGVAFSLIFNELELGGTRVRQVQEDFCRAIVDRLSN